MTADTRAPPHRRQDARTKNAARHDRMYVHVDDSSLQAATEKTASRIAKAIGFETEHPHGAGDV